MMVRWDGAWGVFADFTTVFLKYLLLLRICVDGYRIRRDLGRFHQSILGLMQDRSRLYVSNCISLLIRLNLIICWICIMLTNWIVFTLEGRMRQFLLLMMLQLAQMIRICKGILMWITFLNGLMMKLLLLMRVHLILLLGSNDLILVILGLTSGDKSSLCRRLIWYHNSSFGHICRVSWCWTIHDIHTIGCQMVVLLHHGEDWPLYNAVMNVQNLLFDGLLRHRNVFVLVNRLSIVGNLQSYILSAIRIGPSDSNWRMVLMLEFKHLWRLPFLTLVLVQSVDVFVVLVVAARKNFVRFSLVISTSGRVDNAIVYITVSASKRLWNWGISCMLFLWLKFLFMLSGVWSQLWADTLLVVCTLIVVVLFEWHMSTVESHAWILLFLILDVVLIDVLSATRINEYQIRLLLKLRFLMLKREWQW